MKYFSLFNKEEIHSSPKKKVVPAAEFTTLLEAEEILKKTHKDVEEFKKKTNEECIELKKQAKENGFQEGLEKFNKTLFNLDKEIKDLREEFNKKIVPIAIQAAKKILGEELKLNPERITDIVIQALKPINQHRKIKIYVNKNDKDILENDKLKIKKILEQAESFSIQERIDIEPGGCIIETEAGIINAQLENQWRALESAFKSFIKE
jgi:type III secretion protein L